MEPKLQPLSGEIFDYKTANKDDEARSDIKCTGIWKNMRQSYFDVKVVSPYARSNEQKNTASLFTSAEKLKEREYKKRIRDVEHADFTPLVFSCTGGIASKSRLVLKRLAELMSERQNVHVSQVSGWLRVRLSFALLRTTILCCRGTRRKKYSNETVNTELAIKSAQIKR